MPTINGPDSQNAVNDIARSIHADLLELMGYSLRECFADLPDVIPVDSKLALQHDVLPELTWRLGTDEAGESQLDWLEQTVKKLVPGDSGLKIALPALYEALDPILRAQLEEVVGERSGNP